MGKPHHLLTLFRDFVAGRVSSTQALEFLDEGVDGGAPAPSPADEEVALSAGQRALWMNYRLAPEGYAYNVPLAFESQVALDASTLRSAWRALCERHAALRAVFAERDGEPVQRFAAYAESSFEEMHVPAPREGNGADRANLVAFIDALSEQPFALERGPLARLIWLPQAGRHGVVVLLFHHIVTDGTSLKTIVEELQSLYGDPQPGPARSTYAEFIAWQRAMLASPAGDEHRRYWAGELAGHMERLDLFGRRPSPTPFGRGELHRVEIDSALRTSIKELSVERSVTPYAVMLGAFIALLHRHSQLDDIRIGTPLLARPNPGFASTVGLFTNMAVVRTRIGENERFADLLQQVWEKVRGAIEHGDYPYAKLRDESGNPASGVNPSFHAACYFQNWRPEAHDTPGREPWAFLEPIRDFNQRGEFDLVLDLVPAHGTFFAYFKYNPDVYTREMIAQLSAQYIELLRGVVRQPERELHAYALMGSAEEARVLELGCGDSVAYPSERTFYELFVERAQRHPDTLAVLWQGTRITYGELDRRAAACGRALSTHGIARGMTVGILMEHGLGLLVGLLGALRLGATYVPLDPAYPAERLAFMAKDSGAAAILTQPGLPARTPWLRDIGNVVILDERDDGGAVADAPFVKVQPDDLAYVIYTSGSTGNPKGVQTTHRGALNFLFGMQRDLAFGPSDSTLSITSICFDPSVLELYLPLLCGGHLEILPASTIRDGFALKDALDRTAATVLQATPATFEMLFSAGWTRRHAARILCGGEAMTPALATELLARADAVYNVFGPTEATVWNALGRVDAAEARAGHGIPVGRPVQNLQYYVVDRQGNPLPVGVPGELYIGGDGLARGYRNLPEQTAKTFIANRFHPHQSALLYKSGDVARLLPDGRFQCLGRVDHQVKLRGHRIELGGIEETLKKHHAIGNAAVVVSKDAEGHGHLHAFLIAAPGARELGHDEVKALVRVSLPEYMVPSRIVYVPEFPLTPSRKVDRKRLASGFVPEGAAPAAEVPVKRASPAKVDASLVALVEREVAAIVGSVLKTGGEGIDPKQQLGEIGFDSIRFTALSVALRAKWAIEVKPTVFYEHGTVRAIVAHVLALHKDVFEHEVPTPARSVDVVRHADDRAVAIIGMAGRFPRADSVTELWEKLLAGEDLVTEVPRDRWDRDALYGDPRTEANKTRAIWGGFVRDVDKFDAAFFGISPREAELMDPQHRLFLEAAWHAIEDAGYRASDLQGSATAVLAGAGSFDYWQLQWQWQQPVDNYTLTGIAHSTIANRVSFLLNLVGPSGAVDTACSSSLVAVHRAVKMIQSGECRMALAGGVSLMLSPYLTMAADKAGMMSPVGRCKTFDASADGYVRGEGVGVLFMKALSDAERDGDPIHAVIRGSAENHGGRTGSFTAPNPVAQGELVARAHAEAGFDPATVTYIETHGTGTALGDPIEIDGLKKAFAALAREGAPPMAKAHCGLGSVKTSMGHLENAAGIAGLVKVALAMKHGVLPGLLHHRAVNPYIELEGSPFFIDAVRRPWERLRDARGIEVPRRAGVSSFGFGGANAHVALEEYVPAPRPADAPSPRVLALSAKTREALAAYAMRLGEHLEPLASAPAPSAAPAGTRDSSALVASMASVLGWDGPSPEPEELWALLRDDRVALARFVAGWNESHGAAEIDRVARCRSFQELLDVAGAGLEAGGPLGATLLGDVAYTLHVGREPMRYRAALAVRDLGEAARALIALGEGRAPAEPLASLPPGALREATRSWLEGAEIDWRPFYASEPRRRVHLPGYAFARARHWLPAAKPSVERAVWLPAWTPCELAPSPVTSHLGTVLLVGDDDSTVPSVAARLRALGARTVVLRADEDFGPQLERLAREGTRPSAVIQDCGLSAESTVTASLERTIFSSFRLTKALIGMGIPDMKWLHVHRRGRARSNAFQGAVSGFHRTMVREKRGYSYKRVEVGGVPTPRDVESLLRELLEDDRPSIEVRYENGERSVRRYVPADVAHVAPPLRRGGTYLITGGAGGIGRVIAEYLRDEWKAEVVICGRATKEDDLPWAYLRADVTDSVQVRALIAQVKARFGGLDGIFHLAGVVRDASIYNKTEDEVRAVLAPKVEGTLQLDEATKDEDLSCFVMFSSLSAIAGNAGQCDYAYANGFMDHFASEREAQVQRGERRGRTISINWPLWRDGGMGVSPEVAKRVRERSGVVALDRDDALELLREALEIDAPQIVVAQGACDKIEGALNLDDLFGPPSEPAPPSDVEAPPASPDARASVALTPERLTAELVRFAASILKVAEADVDPELAMSTYGLDSLGLIDLSSRINQAFDIETVPAIFYEAPTLAALTALLLETWPGLRVAEPKVPATSAPRAPAPAPRPPFAERDADLAEPIAVIGLACVMPGSPDARAFWQNLVEGRDLVGPQQRAGGIGAPGGYIEDVDKFDAAFFDIGLEEARLMDPQQRIFLETVWKAIEDAGYRASDLAGSDTALYVGVATADYRDILRESGTPIAEHTASGISHCVLANRISHLLDLRGPSEPVDTACSSSLVAIHRGAKALRRGECGLVIAGGVNVILTSLGDELFAKAGVLSKAGRSRPFDAQADGYVRGEGAGAVLLKRLRDAERDGDTIYGLVRGGAQNHGGYSNALTAPNPRAQSEVIQAALRDAGLAMRDVSYVEAHGTGTLLGDSVELNGLVKAVRASAPDGAKERERFWLGSVKSNIGHLETASGIASVIKVLFAMKQGTLPASLHYTSANPYVDGRNNPFEVVRDTMPWPRRTDAHGAELPRRAGVSSFGFGGTNAHLVLEEHRPAARVPSAPSFAPVFVLSARTEEQVRIAARTLAAFLREPSRRPAPEHEAVFLHDVAYTLHVGREELDVRAAVLASSLDDLVAKLDALAGGGSSPGAIFSGAAPRRKSIVGGARRSREPRAVHGDAGELARGWVSGAEMDWKARYQGASVRRVPLPTYPFAKTVCWVAGERAAHGDEVTAPADGTVFAIEAGDSLIADHVVQGAKVLPGVALLELARAAGERAGRAVRKLRKVAWEKPVVLADGDADVRLEVQLDGDRFTIRSRLGSATVVHASGELAAEPGEAPERIDVVSVAFACTEAVSGAEFYRARERAGFAYGPRYRAIAQLRGGESEAIAPLRAFDASYAATGLESGVMDAALQAIAGIRSASDAGSPGDAASLVPFAVEEVAIHGALSDARYVYASVSPGSHGRGLVKYDVSILDGSGAVLVRLARYAARALVAEAPAGAGAPAYETVFTYDHPSLRDHVVFDERVVLGVTYCSMAIEAMAPRLRDGTLHVQRLFFVERLALAEGEAATVAIRAHAGAAAGVEARLPFEVVYAKRGTPGDVLASRGEYVLGGAHGVPERRDWPAIQRRASHLVPADDVYRATEVHGIRIGDSLRTIGSLAYGPGETLARLAMPEGTAPGACMLAEPALLNGAVMSSIFGLDAAPTSPFLPILVKEIHVYAPVGAACWAHSVVRKQNGEVLIVDIALCDDAGSVLLELRELTLKRVRAASPALRAEAAPLDLASLTGEYLRARVAGALDVAPGEIDDAKNFMDLGLDSASLVGLTRDMEKGLGIELFPTLFFEHQNIPELAEFLLAEHRASLQAYFRTAEPAPPVEAEPPAEKEPAPKEKATALVDDGAIAIIGMAGRFAGSANVDEFWENLVRGEDLIREIPPDHFDYRPWFFPDGQQLDKTYCKWGSFIDDVDKFDAPYFNVSPREAQVMDPQLRVLMETIFHTAEDAGYGKRIRGTNTGMYVGTCFYDYKQEMDRVGKPMGPHDGTGNSPTMMSNRPSFFFNLRGPSLTIDTACSSTLVALHLAASALRHGECEMAFVAGVNLLLCSWHYRYFSAIEALSYSGRCHTFDNRADGYVPGESVCAVLLKPLARAIADGDRIHALVRGTAINHGGATQSITAPSVKQEAQVILDAWRAAGVTGDDIGYIEAHGTGTRLGDPIEIDAIKRAFAAGGGSVTREKTCAVGSAKAHVGHAEGAAGLVGVIKAVLSLQHRTIPAMPKFHELNEFIKLDGSPLHINREPIPWERPAHGPRTAGVSSFGFGGAFAHAVVQEWEEREEPEPRRDGVREEHVPRLFTLSARDPERLDEVCARLEALLRSPAGAFVRGEGELASMPLDRIEATLLLGREEMACRAALVAASKAELLDGLAALRAGRVEESRGVFTGTIGKASRAKVSTEEMRKWIAARDGTALARAWVGGAKIEWAEWYEGGTAPRTMSLFEYPFARNRYWFPTPPEPKGTARASESRQYVPRWVPAELGPIEVARSESVALAFCEGTVRAVFVEAARGRYARLIVVRPGAGFRRLDRDEIEIDPARTEDYARLVALLEDEGVRVESVVHLWSVRDAVDNGHHEPDEESVASFRARGLHSVFHIVKAFGARRTMTLRRFVYVHGGRRAALRPYGEALGGGFAASLTALWPALAFSAVSLDAAASVERRVERVLRELTAEPRERARDVAFFGDLRHVRELTPIEPAITPDPASPPAFARGDVVLVTGGAGALGTLVARDLLDRAGARVVLLGRAALDGARRAAVDALRERGDVDYVACDVADRAGIASAVAGIQARYGRLDGVIHAAGTNDGKPIHEQDFDAIERALRAKVDGLAALDEATRDARLKVFAIFSSVASILGDFGQCHYAVSNRFADAYGELREARRAEGARHGRTVVINWPLWRDGGMHWSAKAEERYLKSSRLTYLESDDGLALFDAILRSEGPAHRQVVHFEVDPAHARTFDPRAFAALPEVPPPSVRQASAPRPEPTAPSADEVRARVRDMAARLLDADPASLPLDASLLELGFDSILLKELALALGQTFALDVSPSLFFNRDTIAEVSAHLVEHAPAPATREEPPPAAHEERAPAEATAIIGISARFPGAPDLESFWRDLQAKRDRVTEIPLARWDWSHDFYEGARITKRRSISKWGGFLEDADKFDAEFFRIAPAEAEVMDPQHRVFLEASWKAIEDAGYAPSSLAGKAIGVFAGVQFNDYLDAIRSSGDTRPQIGTGNSHAMLANRVSFVLDLHGPSEAVDTACSSSLVAVHRAIASLRRGECEMALAGGVSLVTEQQYVVASQLGMLSPDGRCKPFDARANGFVKGEGVGALLLKPLARALADRDPIWAVVRGSAVNHGGRASSLTAPDPKAQARVVRAALADAGVDASSLGYVEAHGTGTELGDPVEIDGLNEALGAAASSSTPARICAVGSVKSNIGHLEAASGMAGLVKVVLALRKKCIPGTVHFQSLNPHVRLGARLAVAAETRPWAAFEDEHGRPLPRRAGVSAFGYGGANAHVVLEEWDPEPDARDAAAPRHAIHRVPLSAKTEPALRAYAALLREHLAAALTAGSGPRVQDVAYTLRAGRDVWEHRVVFVAGDVPALVAAIDAFLNGVSGPSWYLGTTSDEPATEDSSARRISLPSYPFERVRHWVGTAAARTFHVELTGAESFLVDHRIDGRKVLPATAHLELARRAGGAYAGRTVTRMRDVVWSKPVVVDGPLRLTVELAERGGELEFAVVSGEGATRTTHACGWFAFDVPAAAPFDAERASKQRARCTDTQSSGALYGSLSAHGYDYGPSFRLVRRLLGGEREAVAELSAPIASADEGAIDPGLLDGAFQAIVAPRAARERGARYLPYALAEIALLRPVRGASTAFLTLAPSDGAGLLTADLRVVGDDGEACVAITGLAFRAVGAEANVAAPEVPPAPPPNELAPSDARAAMLELLAGVIAEETGTPRAKLRASDPFEKYGIDSVMILSLTGRLEAMFGRLSKTLFFEHRTLAALAAHLAEHHAGTLPQAPRALERTAPAEAPASRPDAAIAIIGMAARFPMAGDLAAFWENLTAGRDGITEIPAERWNHAAVFAPEKGTLGATYGKWGGFLDGVDLFDAKHFKIAPRDAIWTDPQERLFLETAWGALQDAGYAPESVRGARAGVYVGVMYGQYQLLGSEIDGRDVHPGGSYASIANRVSYTFDLRGPSIALDTMCSSSLTAIKLACDDLHQGDTDLAIAGGVNVTIHPNKYTFLGQGRYLSSDGRCRSFGEGGDGYVPGEGVGAVVLKPLDRAVRDGDVIHGVIRAITVNHGGKTNGYTVPNPDAQRDLILAALEKAKVHPRAVSYLEAHGTGTALGDPIEIRALASAFESRTRDRGFCAIGSVKSNIGHLESAAGVAGLVKVLLQMKHGKLVPSLHAERLNPNIDMDASPFVVQRRLADWERPSWTQDGRTETAPRIAGISSFGAGGANAHLIVEQYEPAPEAHAARPAREELVVLSAHSKPLLQRYAESLLAVFAQGGSPAHERRDVERIIRREVAELLAVSEGDIDTEDDFGLYGFGVEHGARLADVLRDRLGSSLTAAAIASAGSVSALAARLGTAPPVGVDDTAGTREELDLAKLAYTLQMGREPMEERLAFVAADRRELEAALRRFCAGEVPARGAQGTVTMDADVEPVPAASLAQGRGLEAVGRAWTSGTPIDWNSLHGASPPGRLALPAPPLDRQRYWVDSHVGTVQKVTPPARDLVDELRASLAETLLMSADGIDADKPFTDLGMDSVAGTQWIDRINARYGTAIVATATYEYTTVRKFARYLAESQRAAPKAEPEPVRAGPVAQPSSLRDVLHRIQRGGVRTDDADRWLRAALREGEV